MLASTQITATNRCDPLYGGRRQSRALRPPPEPEEGSTNDWAYFDNFAYSSSAAISDSESEWDLLEAYLDWVTASTSSSPISPDGTTLGVSKTAFDTTNDSICDAQSKDKTEARQPPGHITTGSIRRQERQNGADWLRKGLPRHDQ